MSLNHHEAAKSIFAHYCLNFREYKLDLESLEVGHLEPDNQFQWLYKIKTEFGTATVSGRETAPSNYYQPRALSEIKMFLRWYLKYEREFHSILARNRT
jgi:hypothetical protein